MDDQPDHSWESSFLKILSTVQWTSRKGNDWVQSEMSINTVHYNCRCSYQERHPISQNTLFVPTMPQRFSDESILCSFFFLTWSTMITNIDFEFKEPWTWISTQLNFWLVILLLYIAKERHTWVLCVRQMKINGNNKIIFHLTSLSICFSKSPGYWMCLSLHSFPLQTSAPPSPASHCTGLWEHK